MLKFAESNRMKNPQVIIVKAALLFFTIILGVSVSKAGEWNSMISTSSNIVWQDESGKDFKFSDLQNKNLVISMIYTTCKKTCPMLTLGKMHKIEEALAAKNNSAEFILITFNPSEDSVSELAKFKKKLMREKTALNPDQWHILRGSEKETHEFAAKIGLGDYWKMDDHIQHGFKITYVDQQNSRIRTLSYNNKEVSSLFE